MFVAPGGPVQIAIALTITFMFFALSMRCTPFSHPLHDIVKALSEVAIFLVLLSVLLIKPSLLGKQKDLLGEATVVAFLALTLAIMFFTFRAAKNLIGEIVGEINALKQRTDAYSISATKNPMSDDLLRADEGDAVD